MTTHNSRPKFTEADKKASAILNLCPDDLPGEEWADVPGLDGMVCISNKGRLKRMGREIIILSRGISYMIGDKILKLKFHYFFNKYIQQYTCHPVGVVCIENKSRYITISRMVYHCFVEPFDLKDNSVLVVPRDHNGLNMDASNLIKVTYAQFQQHIVQNKRRDPEFWKSNSSGKPFYELGQQSHNIEISQYNLQGKLLATFPSISVAAKILNVSDSSITSALSNKRLTGHGFIWAKGSATVIPVTAAVERLKERRGTVSQYSEKGKRLRKFKDAGEAAAFAGRDRRAIHYACQGKVRVCAGYLWSYGTAKQLTAEHLNMQDRTN